ncbi:MAG TPA: hypothetical protein VK943_11750 [Arenibaculum sp.]|nr:hypothetical protein [Arenibaculum sp.]
MTMLAERKADAPVRRLSTDTMIVHGLFVVTVLLLVASGITGWLEAQRKAAAPPATPTAASVDDHRLEVVKTAFRDGLVAVPHRS